MKEVVTEDNYKRKSLGRAITLCWTLLIVCFVVKLFGGNFFAYIGESKVANYIEQHFWLLTLVQFVFYFIGTYILLLITYKGKRKVINIISIIVMFIVKVLVFTYIIPEEFSYTAEAVGLILLPIILGINWKYAIFVQVEVLLFQVISLFTKNLSIFNFPDTEITAYMYMIDYYIMLMLSYLYLKKGDFLMGRLGVWFLSTDKTQLEAYKKHLEAKKDKKIALINKKHDAKVAKVDAKIEKC